MSVLTETVDIADGMAGHLARPAGPGPYPGVLVGMELFGVSDHVRQVCGRLAGLGFTALAPDLYHRVAPGTEFTEDAQGRERAFAALHALTREEVLSDVRAARDHLTAAGCPRVAMVGLSVGGHVAYLAATELDLSAVVIAYGGWLPTGDIPLGRPSPTLDRTHGITAPVLLLVGDEDALIPPEHRRQITRALRAAGVRHELVEYPGVGHGFLSDRRAAHDPAAAEDAWERIGELLTRP